MEGYHAIGYLGPLAGDDVRASAIAQALARHRLTPLVQYACREQADDAYRGAAVLLQEQPALDVVVCATDAIAVGAWHAARDCGRQVPADLHLTGYGDLPLLGVLIPDVMTVQVPTVLLGELAVRKLAERRRQPALPPSCR